jgi:hypothetical protein
MMKIGTIKTMDGIKRMRIIPDSHVKVAEKHRAAKKFWIKALAAAVLVAFGGGYSVLFYTSAYFTDSKFSAENIFQAGTLSFDLDSSDDFHPLVAPENTSARGVLLQNTGSLPFKYSVVAENFGGDIDLCGALELKAKLNGGLMYDGTLAGLALPEIEVNEGNSWEFSASLPVSAPYLLSGKTCEFDLSFNAWQANLSGPEHGFTHNEKLSSTIQSGVWASGILINELLVRPSNNGKNNGEWIELYNLSPYPVDLTGWYIKDAQEADSHKIFIESCRRSAQGSVEIEARGFLVIYGSKSDPHCKPNGFQLNNHRDEVRLFDPSDNMIDSFSYPPLDCEGELCEKIGKNITYSRLPDGSSEWGFGIPTPGSPNVPYEKPDINKKPNEEKPFEILPDLEPLFAPEDLEMKTEEREEENSEKESEEENGEDNENDGEEINMTEIGNEESLGNKKKHVS